MPVLSAPPSSLSTAPSRLNLVNAVLPAAPGTTARLDLGVNVLLAGAGDIDASVAFARQFPRSRFLGTEPSPAALANVRDAIRLGGLQNFQAGRPETLRQARLGGIFEFVIRQGGEPAAPITALSGLLHEGGLLFDLGRALPSPAQYHHAGLVILRSIRLPDGCACIIAGNWLMTEPRP
jgi:hypothetical protein